MELLTILKYTIAVVSVLLIVIVLLQVRSGGVGTVFGGANSDSLYRTRRGFEAFLYNSTIVLGIVFAIMAIAIAVLNA